ncbi:MAG: PilZ domain-containing protein [Calditrichaeota bacterium]|nr:MAG: PilZ domain-containing protein [Calditrichota bacterium]
MIDVADKREFTRVQIHIEVETDDDHIKTMHGETNNLSMGGFFVETRDKMEIGYEGKMELFLDGGFERVPIEVHGKVVRANKEGYGVEIVKVYGVDSYSHLKNLVMYNAPDFSKIQAEFDKHCGIRPIETRGQITVID